MSTFTHAGTSRLNGSVKVRFANDALRVKVLEKNGHTEVDLIELPNAMTKEEAVAYLQTIEFFKAKDGTIDEEVRAAIEDSADRRAPKEPKVKAAAKPKAPKAPKVTKPSLEGIRAKGTAPKSTITKAEVEAQLKEIEDAPF